MRVERCRRPARRTLSGIAAGSLAVGLTSGAELAGALPQRRGVNYPSPSDCGPNTYLIGNFAQNDRANATLSTWSACGSGKWSADSSYQAQQTPPCNPADSFQAVDFWATVSVYATNWGYGVRTEFDNLRIRDLG